ncbi:MAG: hypothetical protein GQ532_11885 [Methylomarinum sp.]|nr:hypothetical protein [Methylomarinum sp.]
MEKSFTAEQLSELREEALTLVKATKLGEQSWGNAWSGKYPDEPTDDEIQTELKLLKEKVTRLLSADCDMNEEYKNTEEVIRMVAIESCKSINIL